MKKVSSMSFVFVVVISVLGFSAEAKALVNLGSSYEFSGENIPDSFGPEDITFDGISELVHGGTIRISENVTEVSSTQEWIEFSVETALGTPLSTNPQAVSRVDFKGIEFVRTVRTPVENEIFVYFSRNGVPLDLTGPSFGGSILPHPTNESVSEVWFPPAILIQVDPPSDSQDAFATEIFRTIARSVGVSREASGFHLGALYSALDIGDFDQNGVIDDIDIDLLAEQLRFDTGNLFFDVGGDGALDAQDKVHLVEEILDTFFGDATLDKHVDANDLNNLALHWREANTGWMSGDFTGDGLTDSSDLNLLALNWRQSAPVATASVPEPGSFFLAFLFGLMSMLLWRGHK